jgi:hypothetical protein
MRRDELGLEDVGDRCLGLAGGELAADLRQVSGQAGELLFPWLQLIGAPLQLATQRLAIPSNDVELLLQFDSLRPQLPAFLLGRSRLAKLREDERKAQWPPEASASTVGIADIAAILSVTNV